MEKKVLSFYMLGILTVIVAYGSMAAARESGEQGGLERQVQLRVENQKVRLDCIEEVVLREQQRIEEDYINSLDELRQIARQRASRFEGAIRMVWTEFIRESAGAPYADGYFSKAHINFLDYREIYEMRSALWGRYSLSNLGDFLMDEKAREQLKVIVTNDISAEKFTDKPAHEEARELLSVLREIELQADIIENRREACLISLEQWKRSQEEDVFAVIGQIKTELDKPEAQVVEAIGHDEGKMLAMVGGEIVRAGDIIDKVKVVRIFGERIEFERGSRRWERKIGEAVD